MVDRAFLAVFLIGCTTWGYDNRASSSFSLGDSKFVRESFYVGADMVFDIAIAKSSFNFTQDKGCDYYLALTYALDRDLGTLALKKFRWDNLNKFKHYLAIYPNFDTLNLDFYDLHGFCRSYGESLVIEVPGFDPVVLLDNF